MALHPGDFLQGLYRVGPALGQGGMGSVFQAVEEPLGLELTVKQLRLDAPDLLESFRGEFALLSRVSAPNLLRVVDFGSERLRGELHHYYVAERVDGVTLAERAPRASAADVLRAAGDAVMGLAALHDAGIRHGDFTPANVLVDRDGRGVLIDLGCARPFGITPDLAGTERYLAPELLAGKPGDARADLFGVGRTLESVFSGRPRPPAQVERLIERLLRPEPSARPGDCAEVLEALGRKPRIAQKALVPTRLLGREGEVQRFEAWLEQWVGGDAGPRVFGLWGGAGMGLSRLVRELTWIAQLRVNVLRARSSQPVGQLLQTALGLPAPVSTRRGALAALGVLCERAEPLLLVIEDAERLPSEQQELLVSLVRSLGVRGNLGLLVSSRAAFSGEGLEAVECGALPRAAIEAWASSLLTEKRVHELATESGGSPKRLEALLAEALGPAQPSKREAMLAVGFPSAFAELKPTERETLALIHSQGGQALAHHLGLGWQELDPLLERRLIERDGEELLLAPRAREAIERGALTAAELSRAHLVAAGWFALQEPEHALSTRAARVIHHLVLGNDLARAEALFSAEVSALRAGPRQVGRLLLPLLDASQKPEVLLDLAELLYELLLPRAAVKAAARAARHGRAPAVRRRAALIASDALNRLGRPARAELLLGGLWAAGGQAVHGAAGAEVLQRLARARLSRGDYAGARSTAERALDEGPGALVAGLAHETLGVAYAYLGEPARAEQELNQALALLGEQARPRDRSRIQSHRATVAFRAGRVELALADYAGALALAEEHDLDDLIATGLLNLGTAEQQAGLWSDALRHYERGVTFARVTSRVSTELTLAYNLANLYAEIGAFERAEEALARLEQASQAARLAHFEPGIALIRAEIALLRGEPDTAERELLAAERLLAERAQPRESFEVRLRRVDVELLRDEPQEAERKLNALSGSQPQTAEDLGLGLELARARVDAALGRPGALERFESARARAQREGLLALEAVLETELSRALQRLGRLDDARARSERARRLWDRIGEGLPVGLAASFWRHASRAHLVEPSRSFATPAGGSTGGHDAEAYRRLLALNRRLNSSLSLERVLEYAVQAALDLTEAERAFLLLTPEATTPGAAAPAAEVVVARSTDPALPEGEGPSQSIVRRTLEREEPILTTDAQGDPRFAGQGSVHALRLKSVLSVPVLSPSGVLGVLYVDCRVQRGRFSEAERGLLLAFSDQLALAIVNARLHQELERKNAEVARQKHALEQLSRGQAREIERLKREVQTQRQSLELRYDYSQIVGRGPAMRAVLERLDRVIDAEASVLVLGESGTGKELVARAIHFNGPRKAGPFMGINCAALPEALLESELFGHVRGAFTGADRDKLGLLQSAAGGTLFLDEVGELPLSLQAKLLRVLQERELRPVGSEKSVPLDVRLVAATHRDLERALAEGRFREDLYYRIAVVTVALPALRERPEDLPALCEKILERLARDAGKKPPELAQDALRRLSAHPFPGNVRELENVLTRAFVLAPPGAKIRAEDLDLGGRRAPAPRARSRRDFETDEKERILAALRAARWNVSVVSRSLGIPRNTLYRKLARYGLERAV